MVAYFLPAVDLRHRIDGDVRLPGVYGMFWSSTPSSSRYAWDLRIHSTEVRAGATYGRHTRALGLSVRCVQELTDENQV